MSGTGPGLLEWTKLSQVWPVPGLEKSHMVELGLELKQVMSCWGFFYLFWGGAQSSPIRLTALSLSPWLTRQNSECMGAGGRRSLVGCLGSEDGGLGQLGKVLSLRSLGCMDNSFSQGYG